MTDTNRAVSIEIEGYDLTDHTTVTLDYNNLVPDTQQGMTGMHDQY